MIFKDYSAAPVDQTVKPSLAPALLGAGGGFMVGGPVGAAIGGAIGYVVGKSQAKTQTRAKVDALLQEMEAEQKAEADKRRADALAKLQNKVGPDGGTEVAHSLVSKIPFVGGLIDAGIRALVGDSRRPAQHYIDHWKGLSVTEKTNFKSLMLWDKVPEGYIFSDPTGSFMDGKPTKIAPFLGTKGFWVPVGRGDATWGSQIRDGTWTTKEGIRLIDLYQALPDWDDIRIGVYSTLTATQQAANDAAMNYKILVSQGLVAKADQAAIEAANIAASAPVETVIWGADAAGGGARSVNGFGRYGDLSVRALRIAQSRSRGKY